MAIIKCPQCSNNISDKHKTCPHCELDMQDLTEEKLNSLNRVKSLQSNQTLMTHQFIAMILFLAGCFSYYKLEDQNSPQFVAAQASIVVGFIWYIVNRVRIILAKRKSF